MFRKYSRSVQNLVHGFTLVEMLVVLAIIGLIMGLVGPRVMKQFSGAKSDTAELQIEQLGGALDLFYLETGRYPTSQEGLSALLEKPANMPGWNGPYLKKNKIPMDPWGNDYHYRYPGENGPYDLFSYGADNSPGGESDDKDITSWE